MSYTLATIGHQFFACDVAYDTHFERYLDRFKACRSLVTRFGKTAAG
jgi:hypothetical protein